MSDLPTYADQFEQIAMTRDDSGVLEVRLHGDDGGPLVWGLKTYRSLIPALQAIGADPDTRVVILTGTGDAFVAGADLSDAAASSDTGPRAFYPYHWHGQRLGYSVLDIDVPVIAAINGPVRIHTEVPLLCSVVLAAEHAEFVDSGHIPGGLVPSDGAHLIWSELLGPVRASYFLLMQQTLNAKEAFDAGAINEVLPADQVLPRAHQIAAQLAQLPDMTLRYTRPVLNARRRGLYREQTASGMAFEGLSVVDSMELADRT